MVLIESSRGRRIRGEPPLEGQCRGRKDEIDVAYGVRNAQLLIGWEIERRQLSFLHENAIVLDLESVLDSFQQPGRGLILAVLRHVDFAHTSAGYRLYKTSITTEWKDILEKLG